MKKCTNCSEASKRLGIELDVAHSAYDVNCTVYQRKISAERKKINYEFTNETQ